MKTSARSLNLDDSSRLVYLLLQRMGFVVSMHLPYPFAVDYVCYQKPALLKNALKFAFEITTRDINTHYVSRFRKLVEALRVDRGIVITTHGVLRDAQDAARRLGIETKNGNEFIQLLRENELIRVRHGRVEFEDLANKVPQSVLQSISPYALAYHIPDLASGRVPSELVKFNLSSWRLLEDAVWGVFNMIFGYQVVKLGREALFKEEPDGVIMVKNSDTYAILYECKSRSKSYALGPDDLHKYVAYVTQNKADVRNIHNVELKFFIIVSSRFSGRITGKLKRITNETGVTTAFLEAENLRELALKAWELQPNIRKMIDLKNIISVGLVEKKEIEQEIMRVKEKIQRATAARIGGM